jgi:Xaa-Pro aminopeptidase
MDDLERRERIREALTDFRLDGLVCVSQTDILLLTGYWPVMGASVVVFPTSQQVQVVLPEDEMEIASHSTSAHLIPYQPASLDNLSTPLEKLSPVLKSALAGVHLDKARLGIRRGLCMQPASYSSSLQLGQALESFLAKVAPDTKRIECDAELDLLKATKTSAELKLIRKSAAIAADAFTRGSHTIEAGQRESDVAAAFQHAFETSQVAAGTRRFYAFFFCMSGPNSAKASGAYAHTQQRVIENGDLVLVHANTCADGYWTDVTRTYVVGDESERQAGMRSAIEQARAAALRSIRPGARARDVDAAARGVMEQHGLGEAFRHSTGHGVGFVAANPNALPRIHPMSPDLLENGMTFNVEPAAYFDGYGGMRHCDMVAVADNGAQVLTDF